MDAAPTGSPGSGDACGAAVREYDAADAAHAADASDRALPWETVANAVFDEVVATLIMDAASGLDGLSNALIKREADGSTLLHVVAGWANCQELVQELLDAGVPPDATDDSGWTPLLEAAQEGQIAICKVLLANGATPDLAVRGLTPLRAAAEVGNDEVTRWLLRQPGTWPGAWDSEFFAFLLAKTPAAAPAFLDRFATELNHSKRGYVGVRYASLRQIYGEPHVSVDDTALGLVVRSANARDLLSHRLLKYLLRAKWKAFARAKFRREFSAYVLLLSSYYVPTVWADPDWIQLTATFDYWVAASRAVSWACCVYLLVRVELHEFRGDSARSYFRSFWNWLNVITYLATICSIPLEFDAERQDARNSVLALITVSLWVNLLQFLQVSTESGLLIAMMSHMVKDVYRFLLLYAVFIFGYSGAFYILLRGSAGFDSFINAFITVFFMLFGAIDYSVFSDKSLHGWRWHMGNLLLLTHLVSVVIVLLNILIAMMATTYADVWDAAEAEALQAHAQAILRMEKSLQPGERARNYVKLLRAEPHATAVAKHEKQHQHGTKAGTEPTANAGKTPAALSLGVATQKSSADVLSSRSSAKRKITQGVLAKLTVLPLAADAKRVVNRALNRGVHIFAPSSASLTGANANRSAVHPDQTDNAVVRVGPETTSQGVDSAPTTRSDAPQFMRTPSFLGHLMDTPNLTALEETLFLKSAFDQDDDGPDGAATGKPLGILEDGIRYELPTKKGPENETLASVRELQTQIEQLTRTVSELRSLVEDGAGSRNVKPSRKSAGSFYARTMGKPRHSRASIQEVNY